MGSTYSDRAIDEELEAVKQKHPDGEYYNIDPDPYPNDNPDVTGL